MATLYVRTRTVGDGSKRYSVVYRRGGRYTRIEHAGTFKTRTEALARRKAVGEWLAAGLNPKTELGRNQGGTPALNIVAADWLATRRGWSPLTRRGHEFRLPTIIDGFPSMSVDEITIQNVDAWVAKLHTTYKASTVRLFVQQLRQILDHASLDANPARSKRIELPRQARRTIEPPTSDAVLRAVRSVAHDLVLPLLVMEQLGTRVTETMSLQHQDVDSVRARVRVRAEVAKTREPRWIPANDNLIDALTDRLPFKGTRDRVGSAVRSTGATFSPHDLRHRRASLWSAQGVPPAQAAAWLGHTVDVYLRTYTHVIVDEEIPAQTLASLLR